jgi:hypothetical protein
MAKDKKPDLVWSPRHVSLVGMAGNSDLRNAARLFQITRTGMHVSYDGWKTAPLRENIVLTQE